MAEKKKGASYEPDNEAQEAVNKVGQTYTDNSKFFINPRDFKDGVKYFFRLVGWGSTVQAQFGRIKFLVNRKYGFRHPCIKSAKDPSKGQWFSHIAEPSLDVLTPDSVMEFIKECWEDDRKNRLMRVFASPYKKEISEKPATIPDTENWILVTQVQPKTEGGYSIPIGDAPLLMTAPWSVIAVLFGDTKNEGFINNPDIGGRLYNQDGGYDFSVIRYEAQKKYETALRPGPATSIDVDELYLDENHPPTVDLIADGIKSEECIRLLKIYTGEETCESGDGPEEEGETTDDASTPPPRQPETKVEKRVPGAPSKRPAIQR